jgi:hypothetical protein
MIRSRQAGSYQPARIERQRKPFRSRPTQPSAKEMVKQPVTEVTASPELEIHDGP